MYRRHYRHVHTVLQKCTGSTTGDITEMYRQHHRNVQTALQKFTGGITDTCRRHYKSVQTAPMYRRHHRNVQTAPMYRRHHKNAQTAQRKCTDSTIEMYRQQYRNVQAVIQKCTDSSTECTGGTTEMFRRQYRNVQAVTKTNEEANNNQKTKQKSIVLKVTNLTTVAETCSIPWFSSDLSKQTAVPVYRKQFRNYSLSDFCYQYTMSLQMSTRRHKHLGLSLIHI